MRNLLSAGFHRLWRNKVFWAGMAAMLAFSVLIALTGANDAAAMRAAGVVRTLDDYYFQLAPVIGIFCAVFTGLFIGTEYSEGTMRNKIIAGRTRAEVYLSNFIVCLAAGECYIAAWLIGGLAGIPLIGAWAIGVQGLLLYILIALLFTAALAGIFTLLCMLCSNKAIAVVIAMLLALGLLIAASIVYGILSEPEYLSGLMMTVDGMQLAEPTPNPDYVSGMRREIYQFIMHCLPTGQGILMANYEIIHPLLSILASAAITLAATLAGLFAFRRKNLR